MLKVNSKNFIYFTKNCQDLSHNSSLNPFMWQVAHIIYFFDNLILKNLDNCDRLNIDGLDDNYDSFITPLLYRDYKRFDYKLLLEFFSKTVSILKSYISHNTISNAEAYLISLGILHSEMHIEAFIFTRLKLSNELFFKLNIYDEELIKNLELVRYEGGYFMQGVDDDFNYLNFDNEMPSFKKYVKKFSISKYPVTEYLYLQFVKNNGYHNKKHWCDVGYAWKNNNCINLPLYWHEENGEYYKIINNQKFSLETNLPVSNLSYYEAKAYCKWKGVRLPTETEYEFVSTNGGETKFPWGNEKPCDKKCNINYNNFLIPVNKFKGGDNYKNVSQLIGNIWEWCEEPIYPYNGFVIDPVYREMSYPFFGFKNICKGGCFAVPDFLIHPKYRNAQPPDCRIQFIGFRVCI